ncbi:aminotransferase [Lactococcus hodotermopsidis]|uniref:Aminotransferase n=2 Tax=Pseudolactococcus hodotermopsidis TaxID=2709157 RepID=A0A6A0B8W1_9LACT|nr:aminotransferase [Lactococcus hodotermopsidis]
MALSNLVNNLEESVTLSASARAKQLKAEGRDILMLTLGEPDFVTPNNIATAAKEAIDSGKSSFYTQAEGLPELKDAVGSYFERYYGYGVSHEQVVITTGAKFALYAFFAAVLDLGDEVIIPTPYWVSYAEQVKMVGGKPVFAVATQENNFKITTEQLEEVVTGSTKVLILNSPSNPTGVIYTAEELTLLGNWAVAHGILILADDIYGRLVYNANQFTPISTLSEEIRNQTIVINGVSKTYAMTGWRIGFATGNPEIIGAMSKIVSQTTSNPTTVAQYAAIEALNGDQTEAENMRAEFEKRLNMLLPLINEIRGFEAIKPQGAFYLFPKVSEAMAIKGFSNVTAFCDDILEKTGVALVTGAGFGASQNLRLSYATDFETLFEAVNRLKEYMGREFFRSNFNVMMYVEDVAESVKFWGSIGFSAQILDENSADIKSSADADVTFTLYKKDIVRQISPEAADSVPSLLLQTEDLDDLYQKLVELNHAAGEIVDAPGLGRVFNFTDPDGNFYAVRESK